MIKVYSAEIEEKMQFHFSLLNEKDGRHYAAVEALRLGYGGKKYIGDLLTKAVKFSYVWSALGSI